MSKQKSYLILFLTFLLCLLPYEQIFAAGYIKSKEKSKLVDIRKLDKTIVIDLRYATKNNFTKKKIYPAAVPLLRKETAAKLVKVNNEAAKKGYRIKVWDAYRPFSAQRTLYNAASNKSYVAHPSKGSRHNRGAAVDLTLVDRKGKELLMPSAFDDFTKRAHRNNPGMNKTAKKNMDYLTSIMKKHGFRTISNEWWHYEDTNWEKYPLLDVPLTSFK
ncbi:D-alanyl-D-alanine dipeptidase [Peribacillus glennii]|uniref:D-alanyl-D-alanine dipeptidase n=1 Tax=Peribacillus glennii TaxID=2303991 RepID=A0A372L981_9BACI|nr:D-alanyl-D-alanine dipeptidase [Peribacillus glennii]RFU62088.1 D-alanyl-D-alanine dipeptidase [Peribacillus glennii]